MYYLYIAKSRSLPCHLTLYKKENISSVYRRIPAETSFRKDCWGRILCLFVLIFIISISRAYFLHYDNTFIQYTANCNGCKTTQFSVELFHCFYFCSKHRLWLRLKRTHNLCLRVKIKHKIYTLVNLSFTI